MKKGAQGWEQETEQQITWEAEVVPGMVLVYQQHACQKSWPEQPHTNERVWATTTS